VKQDPDTYQQRQNETRIDMASFPFPSCSSSTLSWPPLPPFLSPSSPPLPIPAPLPSLTSRSLLFQLEGLGERCELPQQPKSISVYFSLNIGHLVATILLIFLRIQLPKFQPPYLPYRFRRHQLILIHVGLGFCVNQPNSSLLQPCGR